MVWIKHWLGRKLESWTSAHWHSEELWAQNPKKAASTNGRGERVLGISAPLRYLIPAIIQQAGDKDLNEAKWGIFSG